MYEEEITYKNISPRAERRLLKEKAAIGRTIGSMAKRGARVVAFDPNAIDADGDKLVQDGTTWERPDANLPDGLSSGKQAKRKRQKEREESKRAEEAKKDEDDENLELSYASPYTMQDELDILRSGDEDLDPDFEMLSLAIDHLLESAFQNIAPDFQTSPDVDPDITTDIISSGFGIEIGSPESSIRNAVDAYNKLYSTQHSAASLVLGMLAAHPELSDASKKKILESIFPDKKERKKLFRSFHESMDYQYGDFSYETLGPISFKDPTSFSGLTPKQITNIVVPSSEEELTGMILDSLYGDDSDAIIDAMNRRSNGENLSQDEDLLAISGLRVLGIVSRDLYDTSTGGIGVLYDDDLISNLKTTIELALTESPEFLKAVHNFGMPAVFPTQMVMGGMAKPGILGVSEYSLNIIGINENQLLQPMTQSVLENDVFEYIEKQGTMSPTDVFRHEWGHYLWSVLAKALGAEQGYKEVRGKNKKVLDLLNGLSDVDKKRLRRIIELFDEDDSHFPKKNSQIRRELDVLNPDSNASMQRRYSNAVASTARAILAIPEENREERERLIETMLSQVTDLINNTDYSNAFINPTLYSSHHMQELWAESVKDFLSPARDLRRAFTSKATIDRLEFVLGIMN